MEVRKINLRLPVELHAQLADLAAWECVSANAVMVAALRNWIVYRNRNRSIQPRQQVKPGPVAPASVPRVGSNQPCPCGSGQKYKRCHGRP
jgi:hypothetical protein